MMMGYGEGEGVMGKEEGFEWRVSKTREDR
jgi:hypothetical protein